MAHESHADWVVLARDTLDALNTAAAEAMHHPVHSNWDADAVAVRLLLRACGNLDGVILLVLAGGQESDRELVLRCSPSRKRAVLH